MGLYEPQIPIFRPIFVFPGPGGMNFEKNEGIEQGVAGYGPQVIAWRWPPLAAFAILTARGPSPEP